MRPRRFLRLGVCCVAGVIGVMTDSGAQGQVVINEVLASNRLTNFDDDKDSSDWVELFNSGAAVVDLTGYSISDDASTPRKWVLPAVSLDPGRFLLIWCSGKDRFVTPPEKVVQADSPIPFEATLVSTDAIWKYLTGQPTDVGPDLAWKDPAFDDASWSSGKPGFGFGDDDDVTVLPPGIGAVFLRHKFQLDPARKPSSLFLQVKVDDGCVTYLNGVRVQSANFPEGSDPQFSSLATANVEARTVRRFDLTQHLDLLKPGENVIAMVEMNRTVASDDLSLIPELGTVPPVLHTSFSLAGDGETIVLVKPDGEVVDTVKLGEQKEDQSYGRMPNGTGPFGYLLTATPGAENIGPSSDEPLVVSDTKFSVNRGFFTDPFDLEVTTSTPDAEIRYTTNGTAPTATTGTIYSGPIRIEKTTVLRAIAYKQDFKSTNVDTQTYIFLDDVVKQDPKATLDAGFPQTWNGTPPDYGMDPDVIGQNGTDKYAGKYVATIKDDLQAVPTLSIVMNIDDMFGVKGLYSNPEARGVLWERASSAELITADRSEEFQINCGIRIQGGAFRSHGLTKKHSLRLVFKSLYGASKLKYRLFSEVGATDSFDTLTLRANSNDGWQWDAAGAKPVFIRDTFGRETVLAMGGVSSHHRWAHVYLNGIYWGFYEIVERPDAAFSATYFGGDKDEWDAMSNDQVSHGTITAWNALLAFCRQGLGSAASYQALLGNNPDGTEDPATESYLDAQNLADYMITNLYVGNTDWPFKNWWTGRRRVQSTGFKFYMWDSEWSLGLQSDLATNQTNVNTGVSAPYGAARANPEFRMLFADRLEKHFSPGGALYVDSANRRWDPEHPERNVPAARWAQLASEVERSLVAESARWGDQHVARPYTRDEHWKLERDNILRAYMPQRSSMVLQQFRAGKLYPSIDAPILNQRGGEVAAGFQLVMRALSGDVHYTLDGTDPRLIGGAISPTARTLEPPESHILIAARAEARYLVPGDGSLGLDWTQPGFDDAAWSRGPTGLGFEKATGLEGEVVTDTSSAMLNVSASIYVRIPFTVDLPGHMAFLSLGVKYDDGYVAYLNGTRVAGQNAPDTLDWSSQALRAHPDTQAVALETIDLSTYSDLLRPGPNVLAIHGLNARSTDNDFLISPELEALTSRGQGITIDRTTVLKARALAGSEWSALTETTFVVLSSTPLRITEIMYHPEPATPDSGFDAEDFEFIELQNTGDKAIQLSGARLTGGIELDLSSSEIQTLEAGAFVVFVRNKAAFASRYDASTIPIGGVYSGKLANDFDTLILKGALDETLLEFTYDDDWYPTTDGDGHSLVIRDPSDRPSAWKDAIGWAPSANAGGSPGAVDPATGAKGGWQLPGDWNQDGKRNVTDAIQLLGRLFAGLAGPLPCEGDDLRSGANLALHDASDDGKVDLGDAVYLLAYLFLSGPAPALGPVCVRVQGCPSVCAAE